MVTRRMYSIPGAVMLDEPIGGARCWLDDDLIVVERAEECQD
jgi:hypothetical protein